MLAHICKDAVRPCKGYIDFCIFKEYNYLYFEEPVQYLVPADLGTSNNLCIGFVYFQRFLFFKSELTAFSLAGRDRFVEATEGVEVVWKAGVVREGVP